MTDETDNAAPGGSDGAEAPAPRPGPACSSVTNDPEELRKPRARTLEVVSQTIAFLVRQGVESCLWVTVTFPAHCKGRKARQDRFDSWRKHFLNGWAKSIWVPEPHKSGEIHFHGVVRVGGKDFAPGFDHDARKRWVKSRSVADRDAWMQSASPDLREVWKLRRGWKKSYGLGHVDVVPLWPTTEPLAVARYIASYASQAGQPKGTRIVRRVGWKRGEELPIKANTFSFAGARASLFGRLKELGDNGDRHRGWAIRAAVVALPRMDGAWEFTAEEMETVRYSATAMLNGSNRLP